MHGFAVLSKRLLRKTNWHPRQSRRLRPRVAVAMERHAFDFRAVATLLKLRRPVARPDGTPQTGQWEVRSALLKLNPGEVLLCQRGEQFAAIERFGEDSPFAKMNGPAQMLCPP